MMLRGVTKSVFDHLGSEQVVVFIEQINNNNINPIQKKKKPGTLMQGYVRFAQGTCAEHDGCVAGLHV